MHSNLKALNRTLTLALATGLVSVLALAGSGGDLGGLALTPGSAEAAQCPGASKYPKRLSKKRAAALVVCLVNKERREAGVRQLKRSDKVKRAAARHTSEMKSRDCFAHTCPGEPSLSGRLTAARYLPCGCQWSAGETIAYGKGRDGSPRKVVNRWMASGSHRSTLLHGGYEHAGVGFGRGTPFSRTKKAGTYTIDLGYKR